MSDIALLRLAAKAAGYKECAANDFGVCIFDGSEDEEFYIWNPLEDDGDALRLAVKLELCLFIEPPRIGIGPRINGPELYLEPEDDIYTAVRLAIVRAAAEMAGRQTNDDDLGPEIVIFICESCEEEYNLPEDTEICPICGSDSIHI